MQASNSSIKSCWSVLGYVPSRSMAVGSPGIAPEVILARLLGFEVPGIGLHKEHAPAEIQHDAPEVAVASTQAPILHRVGIASGIVVTESDIPIVRFPAHIGVLLE